MGHLSRTKWFAVGDPAATGTVQEVGVSLGGIRVEDASEILARAVTVPTMTGQASIAPFALTSREQGMAATDGTGGVGREPLGR